VAYHLQLPPQTRIHNVFHVALFKRFGGAPPADAPVPLPPLVHGRVVPVPLQVGCQCPLVSWSLGAAGAMGWSRCYLDTTGGLQDSIPLLSARGRAVPGEGEVLWTLSTLSTHMGTGGSPKRPQHIKVAE
jgi:hypothetical protein